MFLSKRRGVWYVFFEDDLGKRRSVSTRCRLKADALRFLQQFKASDRARKAKLQRLSLSEFKTAYLQYSAGIHTRKTKDGSETALRELLRIVGDVPIHKLTIQGVEGFLVKKREEASVWTSRKYFLCLSAAFETAKRWGHVAENVWRKVKKPRPPEALPAYFTREQFKQLLAVIGDADFRDLVSTAFGTGMRRGFSTRGLPRYEIEGSGRTSGTLRLTPYQIAPASDMWGGWFRTGDWRCIVKRWFPNVFILAYLSIGCSSSYQIGDPSGDIPLTEVEARLRGKEVTILTTKGIISEGTVKGLSLKGVTYEPEGAVGDTTLSLEDVGSITCPAPEVWEGLAMGAATGCATGCAVGLVAEGTKGRTGYDGFVIFCCGALGFPVGALTGTIIGSTHSEVYLFNPVISEPGAEAGPRVKGYFVMLLERNLVEETETSVTIPWKDGRATLPKSSIKIENLQE